jgi:hypothetical protein
VSKSTSTGVDNDRPASIPMDASLENTWKSNNRFVECLKASPESNFDPDNRNPTITLTPPVLSSSLSLHAPSSPLHIPSITPTLAHRAAWLTKEATIITTLCRQSIVALRTYQATQSPTDLQVWIQTTEAFQSATSLERLQRDRRNMCLTPLDMQALRTREVQYTFNHQHNTDGTTSEQGRLLGFQMAIMERVCAETRRSAGKTHRASPRCSGKKPQQDMSPIQIQRSEIALYIKEATRRRILNRRAAGVDRHAGGARDVSYTKDREEDEEENENDDDDDDEKKRDRKGLVVRIVENTRRRRRRTEEQV